MKSFLKYHLVTLFCFSLSIAFGQEPEMADAMRTEGKIYVVVAIVLVVLAGLIGYLFFIDRKVSRLESPKDKSAR
jgi:membrane protein DedA with SNARE-associated domain